MRFVVGLFAHILQRFLENGTFLEKLHTTKVFLRLASTIVEAFIYKPKDPTAIHSYFYSL